MWDLSCPDWADRLKAGRSPIPDLPLDTDYAALGVAFFDEIRLPDVPDKPKLKDAAGDWFRDIVRAAFGSWDPVARVRHIRDIFLLAPKGSSKTSYSAALMLAAMLMNKRPNAEALFVGPTQKISDTAYDQAAGMIEASPDLKRRFHTKDHEKTIVDLVNDSEMRIKTFDLNVLTGSILFFVLLDELHTLGRNAYTTKVLRQIRGGLSKTPEGLLVMPTTQSDDIPAGAFRDELIAARKIRDGKFRGQAIRPLLPVLYEFPDDIAKERDKWADPAVWPMVMPNLGRSVHLHDLVPDWQSERAKGEHAVRIWASQHLNIEIGVGLKTDAWAGAQFWEGAGEPALALDDLIARCDVAIMAIDGGGLDDLLGLAVIGREREDAPKLAPDIDDGDAVEMAFEPPEQRRRRWLHWGHAWCDRSVLELRQEIAPRLLDFEQEGTLTIYEEPGEDIADIAAIAEKLQGAALLPEENGIGVDPAGIGEIVDELAARKLDGAAGKRIVGVPQGWKLNGATKTAERRLKARRLLHGNLALMAWCVGNAKVEPKGNAIAITKQVSGTAKIDPLVALLIAVALMGMNPQAQGVSVYDREQRGFLVL